MTHGTFTIANALGNGVGDDKAIYAYVPAMIEYYLGEKPALAQVPTWICAERAQRDYVLDNLADLVVKPIDGFGGSGVLIGPDASERRWRRAGANCSASPSASSPRSRWRCRRIPTFDGDGMYPHHVDLRAFVHLRPGRRLGHRARDAGGVDPGGRPRVADRQFVVRRRQQGHLDTHRRARRGGLRSTTCAASAARFASTGGRRTWPR